MKTLRLLLLLVVSALSSCLTPVAAYEIYQGPPNGRFSDTVVLTSASGVPVAPAASLPTQDYQVSVARGQVAGATPFSGFGERTTTGAVMDGLLWPNGTLYISGPAGVRPSIASTSASDAAAGTGIRTMEVHYLDAALAPQAEIVTVAGSTPVLMTATNVRFIQCMHAETTGSGLSAAGIITASFGGVSMSQIGVSDLRCRSSARMVPVGKRAFISAMVGGSSSGTATAATHIEMVATELDTKQYTSQGLFFAMGEVAMQDGSASLSMPIPAGPFSAGTIIAMKFTTDKAALVTGTWFGWLENVP